MSAMEQANLRIDVTMIRRRIVALLVARANLWLELYPSAKVRRVIVRCAREGAMDALTSRGRGGEYKVKVDCSKRLNPPSEVYANKLHFNVSLIHTKSLPKVTLELTLK
jgi:hypothetical protein